MGVKLGLDGVTNYKVGGQAAGGSWLELSVAKNVTLNLEKGEADATTRANSGWEAVVATLKKAAVEVELLWDTADAGFDALKTAFLNDSTIGLQVLDETSGEGLQADFIVMNFPREEPIDGVQAVSCTLKPTYSATAPRYIEGGTATA